nr:flagellar motor protein MotB [Gammaproteobacteria bacterium]
MNRAMRITAVAVAAGVVAACAADDPHRRAKTGAAIGAVAGAVIGKQVGDDRGALVGA